MITTICQAEFRRLFRTPKLWIMLALMMFLLGYLLLTFLDHFLAVIATTNIGATTIKGATSSVALPTIIWAGILLLAVIPLLVGGSISEARHSGRWTLLASSPARPWQIIMGIFLADGLILTLAIALIALLPLSLMIGNTLDGGKIVFALFSLWLMALSFIAATLYCSTLHKDTSISMLIAYFLLSFLFVLQLSSNLPDVNSGLLYYLSHWSHFQSLVTGTFNSVHIVYYGVFLLFFLLLATRKIASYSRKKNGIKSLPVTITTLLVSTAPLVAALWVSLHYPFTADMSSFKNNTIDPLTTHAIEQLPETITVTAVVEDNPALHRQIKDLFTPYKKIKKNIDLNFVSLSTKQLTQQQNSEPLNDQLPADQRYLVLQYEDRKETIYAVNKSLLAQAFRKLQQPTEQWILFLEGHSERSIFDTQNQGLSKLAELLKQRDYQVAPLNLLTAKTIPDNTSVLVIASPKSDLLAAEIEQIQRYVGNGGNLMWLHDEQQLKGLGALLDTLPVTFMPGVLIDSDRRLRDSLGVKHPAVIPAVEFGTMQPLMNGATVILPLARPLDVTSKTPSPMPSATAANTAWALQPWLLSTANSWNETGSLEGTVIRDDDNEIMGPHIVGTYLQRTVAEQRQIITLAGEVDFLSNDYIGLLGNSRLAIAVINHTSQSFEDTSSAIINTTAQDATLTLSKTRLSLTGLFFLLLLPGLLLSYGVLQWRRKSSHA